MLIPRKLASDEAGKGWGCGGRTGGGWVSCRNNQNQNKFHLWI